MVTFHLMQDLLGFELSNDVINVQARFPGASAIKFEDVLDWPATT